MKAFGEIVDYLTDKYPECSTLFKNADEVVVKRVDGLQVPDAVVRVVIGQMLSRSAAKTIFTRVSNYSLLKHLKSWELTIDEYKKLGLSRAKADTITSFAAYYQMNTEEVELWSKLEFEELLKTITKHKGMGGWTASILGIFYFGHPDIFPEGDGTLKKALKKVEERYGVNITPELAKPYRSYLSLLLWQGIDSGRLYKVGSKQGV